MADLRWFAPNPYAALIVPALERLGLSVSVDGDAPARVAVALGGRAAEAAWRFSRAHRSRLALFLWDLPPRSTGRGTFDPVWWWAGRFWRLPRPGGFPGRRGYFSRLRYVAARADACWGASRQTADAVRRRFRVVCEPLGYCYDDGRFFPGPVPPLERPTLVTVSRLEAHKNQSAVLRAAALLGPECAVRIVGRGPEEATLAALARELGVTCSIETGLDDDAVVAAYRGATVVIAPSRFEGFGLGPIEGLACGARVVASDIPPHREFVGHAVPLFPPDDPAALAVAVRAALGEPAPGPSAVAHLTPDAAAARFAHALEPLLR